MFDLMTLEPREVDPVVREPVVEFARAGDGDELHGKPCPCVDALSRVATWL